MTVTMAFTMAVGPVEGYDFAADSDTAEAPVHSDARPLARSPSLKKAEERVVGPIRDGGR